MNFRFRKLDFSTYSELLNKTSSKFIPKQKAGIWGGPLHPWSREVLPSFSFLLPVRFCMGVRGSYECFGFCFFWLKPEHW